VCAHSDEIYLVLFGELKDRIRWRSRPNDGFDLDLVVRVGLEQFPHLLLERRHLMFIR
jgi:hypothetical protein